MRNSQILCVATGMHRSGTNWLGRAIGSIPDFFMMDEPFNVDYGLVGVPRWYLDYRDPLDINFMKSAMHEIEVGSAKFRHKVELNRPFTSIGRALIGSKSERNFRDYVQRGGGKMGIRDPFLLMMVPQLVKMGIPVIVSVRHPAPILKSLNRMGWHIPNEHLLGRDPAGNFSEDRDGAVAAISSFWKGVYGPLIRHLRDHGPEGILIAFHETMFEDVEMLGKAILRFLKHDDKVSEKSLMHFIHSTTQAETVLPDHRRQHDLARNAKVLAKGWRSRASLEDIQIYDRLMGAEYKFLEQQARVTIGVAGSGSNFSGTVNGN